MSVAVTRLRVSPRALLGGYAWLVLVVLLAPTLALIPLSFSGGQSLALPPKSYSLQWYRNLLSDPGWRSSLFLSLKVAALAAGLNSVIGTMAAVALGRARGAGMRLLRIAFLAPLIVPVMVLAVALYFFFARLSLLGSFWSLVLAHTALTLPLVIVTVGARMTTVDRALERAAAISGAGPMRVLVLVLVPILAPAILAAAALAFITSFDEVVIALFLSGPQLETLPLRMWEGITVGGLDNTITAVTSLEFALALCVFLTLEAVLIIRRRRSVLVAAAVGPSLAAQPQPRTASHALGRGGGARTAAPVELVDVAKRYAEQSAVEGVSLTINPGEFVTLLGPSGSGKTTLLSMVAGFTDPSSGEIRIDGRTVTHVPSHRRDIGFVFQNYALFPHLDVAANVAFPLRVRGISRAESRRLVEAALELVQLSGLGSRRIGQLSGGQQQRVALARAIVFGPSVLLMDEPLGALDRNLRLDMQLEIKQLHTEMRQTTIYVTHDQEEALNLSDRIAVIANGHVEQIGRPEELYRRPATPFVAKFFGDANVLRGQVAEGGFLDQGGRTLPLASGSGRGFLAIRPESIFLAGDREAFLSGEVQDVTFQGRFLRIVVDVRGERVAVALPAGQRDVPATGSTIGLGWRPEEATFIPETAG